ncbi:MAG: hypothetical protein WC819_01655 [Parcubacteria group bacterium]
MTDAQKSRCVHLVAVHDKKFEIKDVDEIILMEADVLSGLDVNTEKPVIDAKSNIYLMKSALNVRIPKFITDFSRNEAKKLLLARKNYYEQKKRKLIRSFEFLAFTPDPSAKNPKQKSLFNLFRIKSEFKNKINLHRLTTHIWLQKFASMTNNKECKFLPPKFLPSLSLYITIRKEDKNFRYE